MEERPKNRPSLKLGQRKLSFQQQKGQTVSKTQDGNSRTTQPESTPPLSNSISSDIASTRDEQGKSVTVTTDREVPPLSGLCNLGNTCYINSLLQTLRFCPQFSEWIGELHSLCERIASSQPSKSTSANSRKKETHSNGVSVDVAGYLSLDTRLMADGDGMECSEPQREGASDEQSPSIGLATHLHAVSAICMKVG